jgi:hypothetical protein
LMYFVKEHEDTLDQLWSVLKQRYQPTALDRQIMLECKLHQLKMTERPRIEDYIEDIDDILGELADIYFEIETKHWMHVVLAGLPGSWKTFITTFGMYMRRTPNIEFSELVEHLQAEELQQRASCAHGDEVALLTARSNFKSEGLSRSRSQNVSTFNNTNSKISNCPSPRSSSRSNFESQNDCRQPGNCNFCGKAGHWEQDCRFKQKLEVKMQEMMHQANVTEKTPHQDTGETPESDEESLPDGVETHFVEINDVEINDSINGSWLIDSGASTHVIGSSSVFSALGPALRLEEFTLHLGPNSLSRARAVFPLIRINLSKFCTCLVLHAISYQ